jgi:hypothetical protein
MIGEKIVEVGWNRLAWPTIQPQTGVDPLGGGTRSSEYTEVSAGSHRPADDGALHNVALRRVTRDEEIAREEILLP